MQSVNLLFHLILSCAGSFAFNLQLATFKFIHKPVLGIRSSPFFCRIHFLILGRSVNQKTKKKIGKRNLELGGPITQHNICGAWKQQGRAAYLLPPRPQQHRAAQ